VVQLLLAVVLLLESEPEGGIGEVVREEARLASSELSSDEVAALTIERAVEVDDWRLAA
jgi:hypothetical protein